MTRSLAQAGEGIIALDIFERLGIDRPSYLDIGAYHPFDLSNTAPFYERGCRGINVEANPALMAAFKEHRPEDVNICAAVGVERGRAQFHLDHHSLIPFSKADHATIEVDVLTVDEIVDVYARGVFPDFLTIDIEGMDLAVLESVDYSRGGPKVICVEVGTDTSGRYVDVSGQVRKFLAPHYGSFLRIENNLFLVQNHYKLL